MHIFFILLSGKEHKHAVIALPRHANDIGLYTLYIKFC